MHFEHLLLDEVCHTHCAYIACRELLLHKNLRLPGRKWFPEICEVRAAGNVLKGQFTLVPAGCEGPIVDLGVIRRCARLPLGVVSRVAVRSTCEEAVFQLLSQYSRTAEPRAVWPPGVHRSPSPLTSRYPSTAAE